MFHATLPWQPPQPRPHSTKRGSLHPPIPRKNLDLAVNLPLGILLSDVLATACLSLSVTLFSPRAELPHGAPYRFMAQQLGTGVPVNTHL